jgi:leucyl aminopeptidase (aminopeptidase T)
MIPALGLDYVQVNNRVMQIKTRMDEAEQAHLLFRAGDRTYSAVLDLRYRSGHASGGVLVDPGTVGNLPSGEAYIVPYEGENPAVQSESKGELPVQFGSEVVVFRFAENRVVEVLSHGDQSDAQREKLADEPAYGNIAELGIGVLGEWGVEGVGSTLLDEKLGLHIAFGRSDHFGGVTSPASFRAPQNVIHIDWVYVPSVQRLITVDHVTFVYPGGREEVIIRSGRLVV